MTRNESMVAVGLEVGPGMFLQTFGIGHMYAGRMGTGLAIMVAYWVLQAINIALMPLMIGFVTWPLTLIAFLVMCPTNVIESNPRR